MRRLFLILTGVFIWSAANGHEVRPGYVEIRETANEVYDVSWKQPVRENADAVTGLGLRLTLPPNCAHGDDSRMVRRSGALIEQFTLTCAGGLEGQIIGIEGLQRTITDVFVRFLPQAGESVNFRLTAEQPALQIKGGGAPLGSYLSLGIEHLLFGYDHILFVIGLALLTGTLTRLFWVVTAFTLAHSITLALSVLGIVRLPTAPVEAFIALSILFVAVELMLPIERRSNLASHAPQSIAFIFGLIHGFGFANVLVDIGMPRGETALALALFNIGLEAGQLLVVAVILACTTLAHRFMRERLREQVFASTVFVIGAVSSYWLIARSLAIIAPIF